MSKKYDQLDEPVFITNIDERPSAHGGTYYNVNFKGVKSQQNYSTAIVPTMMNWRKWEHIIEIGGRKGVVLGNLKFKDRDTMLINADSEPRINVVAEREELAQDLADYWASQTQFGKFFK